MRVRTAFTVVFLIGLACFGVHSAAANELPPTPPETSTITPPADGSLPAPTLEPSEVPTSQVTTPEPEDTAGPHAEVAPSAAGEDSPGPADEATGEPTVAAGPMQPAGEPDDPQTAVGEVEAPLVPEATVAEEALVAAAEELHFPRASIGDVNCTNLTVPVTLDNSASTVAVTYTYVAGDEGSEVVVPAGAIRIVNLPVTEDSQVRVRVEWVPLDFVFATALLTVDCTDDEVPYDPRAGIGAVDCAQMLVDVTLDNSRSEVEVMYQVTWREGGVDPEEAHFVVPAGDVQSFPIPVAENSDVFVQVAERVQGEEGEGLVAVVVAKEFIRVDCASGDEPRASIGDVNCTNMTVPVTLDNIRSPLETGFRVAADWEAHSFMREFSLAAGAELVVVPVPVSNHVKAFMLVENVDGGATLDFEILDVDCPRTAARPTVGVQGAKLPQSGGVTQLPQTGGFNLALPLIGVAILAGGAGMLALTARRRRY